MKTPFSRQVGRYGRLVLAPSAWPAAESAHGCLANRAVTFAQTTQWAIDRVTWRLYACAASLTLAMSRRLQQPKTWFFAGLSLLSTMPSLSAQALYISHTDSYDGAFLQFGDTFYLSMAADEKYLYFKTPSELKLVPKSSLDSDPQVETAYSIGHSSAGAVHDGSFWTLGLSGTTYTFLS